MGTKSVDTFIWFLSQFRFVAMLFLRGGSWPLWPPPGRPGRLACPGRLGCYQRPERTCCLNACCFSPASKSMKSLPKRVGIGKVFVKHHTHTAASTQHTAHSTQHRAHGTERTAHSAQHTVHIHWASARAFWRSGALALWL